MSLLAQSRRSTGSRPRVLLGYLRKYHIVATRFLPGADCVGRSGAGRRSSLSRCLHTNCIELHWYRGRREEARGGGPADTRWGGGGRETEEVDHV
ncbi:hypothetical protein FIBSPDRAFT_317276 [Athelia psychrophila]|uniref:Uncharacterized protein n=1 Tax=Athelia psychrophila TaxID=1759441 RepID=A0A167WVN7_9AGAM|nr:hypothetical protein FIBSPDRAFT_317276 [Fibularhizoctonia sp. CBS 109695]